MNQIETKVDSVYNYLLHEILSGKYADGCHILISDVAEACQVSNTPVREALRRLESNGYVEILANQGAVSKTISRESILHTFEIKGVLEGYAARLSIDHLSQYDFTVLDQLNQKMYAAAQNNQFNEYSQMNVDFHMYMYEKCPLPELITLIQDLWKKWSITKSVFSTAPKRMEESYNEHAEIIRLARACDYSGLELFVRKHKENAALQMVTQIHTHKPS